MKEKILNLVLIISILALFSSCTEEIDLELNDSFARLVVEGNISTDSIHQEIILTSTSSYFANQKAPLISGAEITVSDGQKVYLFNEDNNNLGHYLSQEAFAGKPGTTYNLKITNVDLGDNSGLKTYEATEVMKSYLTIDSLYALPFNFFGRQGFRIFGFAQEPATVGDFYLWRYYINGKLSTDTLSKTTFSSDQLANGNYLKDLELGFVFDGKPGDTLLLETNSITEDYFNFIVAFFIETLWSGGSGFTGPPANVKNNISNGAMGYFNTEARTRIELILP